MFRKVLIANRGEIACRIIRTLHRMGIGSVAVYSDADRHALHVLQADEAIHLGPSPVSESYLREDKLIAAARDCGVEAIHPGYGFLSESPPFAQACEAAGIVFIGPTPAQIRDFGLKHTARDIAARAGIPLLPGSELLADIEEARREAVRIGYPVMLKSSAGGGGIGMQLVRQESELSAALDGVERLAQKNFSHGGVFLERYIEHARHIEVQIFGDGVGEVIALGERDCSVQRRNQKVIEETPATGLSETLRNRLHDTAVRLGRAVRYKSAGTVEFVYDVRCGEFYFLEVNTRLQVEHCITEEVTGVDLVEWMVRVAANDGLKLVAPTSSGASIQVRIYAEDPARGFRPSSGTLTRARFAAEARVESWVEDGTTITPYYDPLLAKIIVADVDRNAAVAKLQRVLNGTEIAGIETNLDYVRQLAAAQVFAAGGMTTRVLEGFSYTPRTLEILSGGTQTTIQDYPGRLKYWNVGVPPSGPMDSLSFRLGNRAVGNPSDAAALEITMSGPTLKFNTDAVICLTGARMHADLDGRPIAGAVLDVWQTQSNRLYDSQDQSLDGLHMRGKFKSDTEGRYLIRTVQPVNYPIPSDGPVGAMLKATGRHPWRPAHIHFVISADGYEPVTTHIFDRTDPYLASDAVFAVKDSLICDFVRHEKPDPQASRLGIAGPYCTAQFDFRLTPSATAQATIMDAQRRLAALGTRG